MLSSLKNKSPRQLTLGVQLADDATFENFFTGDNENLTSQLQQSLSGGRDRFFYLWGAQDSGRTHLLQACCHNVVAKQHTVVYLAAEKLPELNPTIFDGLEHVFLLCIDNIDHFIRKPLWQESFFHLYNRILQSHTRLFVTANVPPRQLGLELADLQSRLMAALVFQVYGLSDTDKKAALQLRARRRGLNLPDEVCQFLLTRCSRNMASLYQLLETLDQESLRTQRRLTIPFVKSILHI